MWWFGVILETDPDSYSYFPLLSDPLSLAAGFSSALPLKVLFSGSSSSETMSFIVSGITVTLLGSDFSGKCSFN